MAIITILNFNKWEFLKLTNELFWTKYIGNDHFRRVNMTNRNDNRERINKYPNNKKQDTEFGIDINFRSEIAKRNLQNKPK